MNRPILPPVADADIGPLDEHGQQVWSSEEEQAIARIMAEPDFWPSIAEAEAQIARGEWFTTEQVFEELERRRRLRGLHA